MEKRDASRHTIPLALAYELPPPVELDMLHPICFADVFAVELLLGLEVAVILLILMLSRVRPRATIPAPGRSSRRAERDLYRGRL